MVRKVQISKFKFKYSSIDHLVPNGEKLLKEFKNEKDVWLAFNISDNVKITFKPLNCVRIDFLQYVYCVELKVTKERQDKVCNYALLWIRYIPPSVLVRSYNAAKWKINFHHCNNY